MRRFFLKEFVLDSVVSLVEGVPYVRDVEMILGRERNQCPQIYPKAFNSREFDGFIGSLVYL